MNGPANPPFDAERVRSWAERHNRERAAVAGFVGFVTNYAWRDNCRQCYPLSPTQNIVAHSHPYLIEGAA